jgi:hypothetical protein
MKVDCKSFIETTENLLDIHAFIFRCADVICQDEHYLRESMELFNSSPYLCFNGNQVNLQLRTEQEVQEMNLVCCGLYDLTKYLSH